MGALLLAAGGGRTAVATSAVASLSRDKSEGFLPDVVTSGKGSQGMDAEGAGLPPLRGPPNGTVACPGSIRPVVFPAGEKARIPSGYPATKRGLMGELYLVDSSSAVTIEVDVRRY